MDNYTATIAGAQRQLDDRCASCDSPITDKFCPACGEKQVEQHDFALKHFLEESIEGFTHFDNKFFRTVKVLVTKPGQLSEYFSAGRRVKYLKPLQLFLICNLFFFLLAGKLNIFAQPLYSFYHFDPYVSFGSQAAILQKAHGESQLNTLSTLFNEKAGTESKFYIAIFIPFLALLFGLLFMNTKRYFTEHLVFATHYFSFILVYLTAFTLLVSNPFYWLTHTNSSSTFDSVTSIMNMTLLAIYFAIAAKRFYKVGRAQTAVAAVATTILFTVFLTGYRLLLFYKLIYSIHLN